MKQPELRSVERICGYCGARLEVSWAAMQDERKAQFACPQCGKTDEIDCNGHPHVRVLAPRTDGRGGQYQETMF